MGKLTRTSVCMYNVCLLFLQVSILQYRDVCGQLNLLLVDDGKSKQTELVVSIK